MVRAKLIETMRRGRTQDKSRQIVYTGWSRVQDYGRTGTKLLFVRAMGYRSVVTLQYGIRITLLADLIYKKTKTQNTPWPFSDPPTEINSKMQVFQNINIDRYLRYSIAAQHGPKSGRNKHDARSYVTIVKSPMTRNSMLVLIGRGVDRFQTNPYH